MEQTIILKKPIKPFSNSAHIIIPKKHMGKKASVIIHLDDEKERKKDNVIK